MDHHLLLSYVNGFVIEISTAVQKWYEMCLLIKNWVSLTLQLLQLTAICVTKSDFGFVDFNSVSKAHAPYYISIYDLSSSAVFYMLRYLKHSNVVQNVKQRRVWRILCIFAWYNVYFKWNSRYIIKLQVRIL
jgi:hypothetical protein